MAGDERRLGLEHEGSFIPYELTTAYLVGFDARPHDSIELRRVVEPVLRRLEDDPVAADTIAAQVGWLTAESESLYPVGEAFRWFRLGLG